MRQGAGQSGLPWKGRVLSLPLQHLPATRQQHKACHSSASRQVVELEQWLMEGAYNKVRFLRSAARCRPGVFKANMCVHQKGGDRAAPQHLAACLLSLTCP